MVLLLWRLPLTERFTGCPCNRLLGLGIKESLSQYWDKKKLPGHRRSAPMAKSSLSLPQSFQPVNTFHMPGGSNNVAPLIWGRYDYHTYVHDTTSTSTTILTYFVLLAHVSASVTKQIEKQAYMYIFILYILIGT